MSSFISISDTRRDRLRLALLAGMMALLLGGVAGFNGAMDPYGWFSSRAPALRATAHPNLPLDKWLRLRQLLPATRAEAVVALGGDSRGDQLIKGIAETVDGRPMVSLAIGGASFEESLTFIERQAPLLPALRTLVLTTPLERFAEQAGPDRCREAEPLAHSPLRYLLNGQITQDSWAVFRHPAVPGQHRPGVAGPDPARDAVAWEAWRGYYAAFDPDRARRRLAALRLTLVRLQARGIKVILWAPPVRSEIQELIAADQLEEPWRQLSDHLREIAPFRDLTFAAEIDGVPLTFLDPVHTQQGPLILHSLLQEVERPPIPTGGP